jgi:hypothetical protein
MCHGNGGDIFGVGSDAGIFDSAPSATKGEQTNDGRFAGSKLRFMKTIRF